MINIRFVLTTFLLSLSILVMVPDSFARRGADDVAPAYRGDDRVAPLRREVTRPLRPAITEGVVERGMVRSCEAREGAIEMRMNKLTDLVSKMIAKFDTHVERIQTFYTTKVIPSGKTVANYDSLIADIQAKKADAQAALSNAQTAADNFDCTSDAPFKQFREEMQATKQALQAYRTSIKNLIVAVSQVAGEVTSTPAP